MAILASVVVTAFDRNDSLSKLMEALNEQSVPPGCFEVIIADDSGETCLGERVINEVDTKLKRFVVTVSGKPKAVVMSLDELESLEETAEILSIPGAYEKIQKGIKEAKESKGVPLSRLKV